MFCQWSEVLVVPGLLLFTNVFLWQIIMRRFGIASGFSGLTLQTDCYNTPFDGQEIGHYFKRKEKNKDGKKGCFTSV